MNQKYIVTLTAEERAFLEELIAKGKTQGYRIRHAQILLKLDEIPENRKWIYAAIQEAYGATPYTISQLAKRFVTEGLEAALGRKEQQNRHRKVDGTVEAHMIATDCSEAPEGRDHWTLQMIADELVHLGVVDSISDTAVMNTLKKTNSSPGRKKEWCIPKPGAEFVAKMEDVLDVYECPYDPLCPVICLDETNRQLIEQRSLPMEPGHPERVDYEYRRHGVVDLFVAVEPLACKRVVKVTESRTAVDFAHFLRELVDKHYSHCEKIVLVMDNLNIHSTACCTKPLNLPKLTESRQSWRFIIPLSMLHG